MLTGSILQKLTEAHQNSKNPLNFGVYYKNTLIALCHALEDCILTSSSSPLVIAAFQRGKWYLQEADRYRDIARSSGQIVIMAAAETGFAEHPTSQLPNVALVDLAPTDPVAQEWHLIILSPAYSAMVLCQELSAADYGIEGMPKDDLERKFYGFWTFEAELVKEVVGLAIDRIATYTPQLAEKLTKQAQAIADTKVEQPDPLDAIVCRIVDYLHTSHLDLDRLTTLPHQQALDRNLMSNELQAFFRMAQLIDLADISNPMAGVEVSSLAEAMGQLLDLPAWQIKRLRLAGLLHRFGSLSGSESFLAPEMSMHYQEEAPCSPLTCPLIPTTQVLRTMPQMEAVAKIITHESEWWNGTGSPAGLKADEIPLESRILGLAIAFQQRLAQLQSDGSSSLENLSQALAECKQAASDRFDPKLVDTLALLVAGMQQGLSLNAIAPKLTSSIWLLDPERERERGREGEKEEQLTTDY